MSTTVPGPATAPRLPDPPREFLDSLTDVSDRAAAGYGWQHGYLAGLAAKRAATYRALAVGISDGDPCEYGGRLPDGTRWRHVPYQAFEYVKPAFLSPRRRARGIAGRLRRWLDLRP